MFYFIQCFMHAALAFALYRSGIHYNNENFWIIIAIVLLIRCVDAIYDDLGR